MLEIKTITETQPYYFDKAVNEALVEGWELLRRECFITGSDRATTFYAELERIVDEPEEKEDSTTDGVGVWLITRDPHYPYKCSACGIRSHKPIINCPNCHRLMEMEE